MNAIEVMARAIHAEDLCDEFSGRPYEKDKSYWDQKARAALTALRDNGVTAKMFLAWNDAHGPADEFRAMLDAALGEA